MIPIYDPETGPTSLRVAIFLVKDLLHIALSHCIDRAVRYMSFTVIEKIHTAWVNIIHSSLVVYTDLKGPRHSRGYKSRAQAIVRNIEELDLDKAKDPGIDK